MNALRTISYNPQNNDQIQVVGLSFLQMRKLRHRGQRTWLEVTELGLLCDSAVHCSIREADTDPTPGAAVRVPGRTSGPIAIGVASSIFLTTGSQTI